MRGLKTSQDAERDVFHYQLGSQAELKSIPTASGNYQQSVDVQRPGELVVNSRALGSVPNFEADYNEALKPSSTWRMDSPMTNFARILNAIPFGADQENQASCRRIQHPSDIDRTEGAEEGCGWFFLPDGDDGTLRESVCLLGTSTGPKNTLGLEALQAIEGATWIWNKADAVRREDVKRAARVRDCPLAVKTSGLAFCKSSDGVRGYGIPYNAATGYPKYNIPKMDRNGTETDESKKARCVEGEIAYNIDMCPRTDTGQALSACDGIMLSDACVEAVLKAKGFKIEGLLRSYRTLKADKRPDISLLFLILREAEGGGVRLSVEDIVPTAAAPAKLGVAEFQAAIEKIVRFSQMSATTEARRLVRDVALYMKEGRITSEKAPFGELYFDFCNYYAYTAGRVALHPVALTCLQQEYRKVGCQAAGSGYPKDVYAFEGKSLNQIRAEFRQFREAMTAAQTVAGQAEAVQKCLGISMGAQGGAAEGRVLCDERGIEYMIFSYDVGGTRTLRSRFKSTEGLLKDARQPTFNVGRAVQLTNRLATQMSDAERRKIPGAAQMGYLARTAFTVPADVGALRSQWIYMPDTYKIRLNDQNIVPTPLLTRTAISGTRQYEIVVPGLDAAVERYNLEVEYAGNAGTTWGNPNIEYIDKNLELFQLRQAFMDPVIRYEFHKGVLSDTNGLSRIRTDAVVLTNRTDLATATATPVTRMGLTWRVRPSILGNQVPIEGLQIRNGSIQVIMMSVFVTSENAQIYQLVYSDRYTERLIVNRGSIVYEHSAGAEGFRRIEFVKTGSGLLNRWIHVAVVYDHKTRDVPDKQEDIQDMAVYVDGEALNPRQGLLPRIVLKGYAAPWELSMRIELLSSEFVGNVGWFHVYDQSAIPNIQSSKSVATTGATEGFQSGPSDLLRQAIERDRALFGSDVAIGAGPSTSAIPDRASYGSVFDAAPIVYDKKIPDTRQDITTLYSEDGDIYTQPNLMYIKSYPDGTNNGSAKDCYEECKKSQDCVAFSYTGDACRLYRNITRDQQSGGEKYLSVSGALSYTFPDRSLPTTTAETDLFAIVFLQRDARDAIKKYYGIVNPTGSVAPYKSDEEPSFVNYLSKAAGSVVSMYEAMYPQQTFGQRALGMSSACPLPQPPVSVDAAIADYNSTLKSMKELRSLKAEGKLASYEQGLRNMLAKYSIRGVAITSS